MHWAWLKYPTEFEFTKEPFMLVQHDNPVEAVKYAAGVYMAERKIDDNKREWGASISVKLAHVDNAGHQEMYRYDINTQEVLILREPEAEWMQNASTT